MRKLDTILVSGHDGKDMILRTLQYALENREIRHNTTSIEVLGSAEDDVVSVGDDLEVVVSGVDCAAHEVVVRDGRLMGTFYLFSGTDDIGSRRPEEMVAEEHANRAGELSVLLSRNKLVDWYLTHLPSQPPESPDIQHSKAAHHRHTSSVPAASATRNA